MCSLKIKCCFGFGLFKILDTRYTINELSIFLLILISNGGCFIFCQKEFLDKYESFVQLVAKIYHPPENIPSVAEMRELLSNL